MGKDSCSLNALTLLSSSVESTGVRVENFVNTWYSGQTRGIRDRATVIYMEQSTWRDSLSLYQGNAGDEGGVFYLV